MKEKYQKLNRVEATILDQDDKTLYFMYGKLRQKHIKGETFACPTNVARQLAKCSKSEVGKVMKKLEHLGAITKFKRAKQEHILSKLPFIVLNVSQSKIKRDYLT